jgi:hypothetical protein
MPKDVKPFERLNEQQQKCCVDIAIGMLVIAARVPSFNMEIFKMISDQWANCALLDRNQCRYALQEVTTGLYDTSWEFHLVKEDNDGVITTQFIRRKQPGGGNGEISPTAEPGA